MDNVKTIRLSDVIIPKSFEHTNPNPSKFDSVRAYVDAHGELDKPVVLDGNTLTDNYVRYLVAKEYGLKKIPYITIQEYRCREVDPSKAMTYIVGKFDGNEKGYIWKVTKDIPIKVGDRVMVKSKSKDKNNDGTAVVIIDEIFVSDSDKMLRHKPVIKKVKRK